MIASSSEAVRAALMDGAAWPRDPDTDKADGQVPLGLFRGVRTFEVSSDGNGGTAFHVREQYHGPLLALIWRSMPDLPPSSGRFAQGSKRRAGTGR
jgi:hypothetical protein